MHALMISRKWSLYVLPKIFYNQCSPGRIGAYQEEGDSRIFQFVDIEHKDSFLRHKTEIVKLPIHTGDTLVTIYLIFIGFKSFISKF